MESIIQYYCSYLYALATIAIEKDFILEDTLV